MTLTHVFSHFSLLHSCPSTTVRKVLLLASPFAFSNEQQREKDLFALLVCLYVVLPPSRTCVRPYAD